MSLGREHVGRVVDERRRGAIGTNGLHEATEPAGRRVSVCCLDRPPISVTKRMSATRQHRRIDDRQRCGHERRRESRAFIVMHQRRKAGLAKRRHVFEGVVPEERLLPRLQTRLDAHAVKRRSERLGACYAACNDAGKRIPAQQIDAIGGEPLDLEFLAIEA